MGDQRVAILGASGFVGTRLIENWTLNASRPFRSLIRSPSSLARQSRFPLGEWKLVDSINVSSMTAGLEGCSALVHAMVGDPNQIPVAAQVAAAACIRANVPRLVYISSASVHGQNPLAGTTEDTPIAANHALEYNNAKVLAENALARFKDQLEIVILRPGIVYGPRCQWFSSLPEDLGVGKAYFVEGGRGICNHIYVDNLVHAINLALDWQGMSTGPIYVSDTEALTWREFYRPIAEALGYTIDSFQSVDRSGPPILSTSQKVMKIARGSSLASVVRRAPSTAKRVIKAGLLALTPAQHNSGFELSERPRAIADYETSELHTCAWRLPMGKAQALLNYSPVVSADDGLRLSALAIAEMQQPLLSNLILRT